MAGGSCTGSGLFAQSFDRLIVHCARGGAAAHTFAFADVFLKLAAFFGLEALAFVEALLSFHFEAGISFRGSLWAACTAGGGWRGDRRVGASTARTQDFECLFVNFIGLLRHHGREKK